MSWFKSNFCIFQSPEIDSDLENTLNPEKSEKSQAEKVMLCSS